MLLLFDCIFFTHLAMTESDTNSYTSSDTKSDAASYDIVSSRGPYGYLLNWFDEVIDEADMGPEIKFNKRELCKSKSSKKRTVQAKEVPNYQVSLSTVGSVVSNKKKGKKKVRIDESEDFAKLNPPPGFAPLEKESGSSSHDVKGEKNVGSHI